MNCPDEGIDMSGRHLPLRMVAGDSWLHTSVMTVADGLTITGASFIVYDSDDNVEITGTATVSGLSVTWGLEDEAATALLSSEGDYTHRLRVTLSNGVTQTIYRGPLDIAGDEG